MHLHLPRSTGSVESILTTLKRSFGPCTQSLLVATVEMFSRFFFLQRRKEAEAAFGGGKSEGEKKSCESRLKEKQHCSLQEKVCLCLRIQILLTSQSHLANAIAGNPSTALILWPERGTLEVPWERFSEADGWWTLEEDACKLKSYEIKRAEQRVNPKPSSH